MLGGLVAYGDDLSDHEDQNEPSSSNLQKLDTSADVRVFIAGFFCPCFPLCSLFLPSRLG